MHSIPAPSPLIDDTLDRVIELARIDVPFAASVAQLARQATSTSERHACLDALYRIALDHGSPYLGELVDIVLTELEPLETAS